MTRKESDMILFHLFLVILSYLGIQMKLIESTSVKWEGLFFAVNMITGQMSIPLKTNNTNDYRTTEKQFSKSAA